MIIAIFHAQHASDLASINATLAIHYTHILKHKDRALKFVLPCKGITKILLNKYVITALMVVKLVVYQAFKIQIAKSH